MPQARHDRRHIVKPLRPLICDQHPQMINIGKVAHAHMRLPSRTRDRRRAVSSACWCRSLAAFAVAWHSVQRFWPPRIVVPHSAQDVVRMVGVAGFGGRVCFDAGRASRRVTPVSRVGGWIPASSASVRAIISAWGATWLAQADAVVARSRARRGSSRHCPGLCLVEIGEPEYAGGDKFEHESVDVGAHGFHEVEGQRVAGSLVGVEDAKSRV